MVGNRIFPNRIGITAVGALVLIICLSVSALVFAADRPASQRNGALPLPVIAKDACGGGEPARGTRASEGGVVIARVPAGTTWRIGVVNPVSGAVWTVDGVDVTGGNTFTAPVAATPYSTIDLEYGVPGQPYVYSTTIFVSGQVGSGVRDAPVTTRKPVGSDTVDGGPTQTVTYVNDGSPDGPPPILEDGHSCYWAEPGTPLDPPAEFDEISPINSQSGKYFIPCFVEGDPDESIVYLQAAAIPSFAPQPTVDKGKIGPFNARKTGGCADGSLSHVEGHKNQVAFSGSFVSMGRVQVDVSGQMRAKLLGMGFDVQAGIHVITNLYARFLNHKRWWTTDYYLCVDGHWVYQYSRRCVQWADGYKSIPPWYAVVIGFPLNGDPLSAGWSSPACRDYPP